MLLLLAVPIIILLAWLVSRLRTELGELADRVDNRLEPQIRELTARVYELERRSGPPVPVAPEAVVVPAPPEPVEYPEVPILQPVPVVEVSEAVPPPAPPKRAGDEWEALIGGSFLNKLGAVLVVISVVLFLSYSFAQMGPAGRVAVSLAGGAALLAAGLWIEHHEKYRVFSWGLIGAGWAGLYVTSYAMYSLDAARVIENPTLGAGIQLTVAAAMIVHSLRYRVETLTALAAGCAFAALAIAPSRSFGSGGLIPLAAALVYIARRLQWQALGVFSLIATYGVVIARGDAGASVAATQAYLFLLWLIFELLDLASGQGEAPPYARLIMPLNALGFVGLSAEKWSSADPDRLYLFLAAAAVLYIADAVVRSFLKPGSYRESVILASILCALAIVRQAGGGWAAALLGVEAEVLFLFSRRYRVRVLEYVSAAFFALAIIRLVEAASHGGSLWFLGVSWHDWTPAAILLAAFCYANRELRTIAIPYGWAGSALVQLVLGAETPDHWLALVWTVWAALLLRYSIARDRADFRRQACTAWLLAAFAYLPTQVDKLARNPEPWQWVSLCGGALIGYWMAFEIRRAPAGQASEIERAATAAAASFGASALMLCTTWSLLPEYLVDPSWALLGGLLLFVGLRRDAASLRWQSYILAPLAALHCGLYNMDYAAVFGGVTPGMLSGGFVAATLYAQQFYMPREWPQSSPERYARAYFSLLGSAEVAYLLYKEVSGSALTVAWGLQGLCLLAAGFPLRERIFRISGLILLAGCILKLFFYDLRNLDTIPRILSFMVLGLILLAVSWGYTKYRESLRRIL